MIHAQLPLVTTLVVGVNIGTCRLDSVLIFQQLCVSLAAMLHHVVLAPNKWEVDTQRVTVNNACLHDTNGPSDGVESTSSFES